MSIFQNRNRPRSLQDIKVGNSHTVEVLFQLRRADWDWYTANEQEIEEEIFELLSESIIPRMFGETIEQYHMKRHPHLFPDKSFVVGSKNKPTATAGATAKGKRKNPRKGGTKAAAAAAAPSSIETEEQKPEKDIYFSFGETVQLAYRKTPLPAPATKTIFFKENGGEGFDGFIKLSSRLLIWVSQIDPKNKTNPDAPGVGFHRPEMIPISALFRQPEEEKDE
jgi:hypothetical protein